MQRSEEHDKAKYMAAKAEEEQQSTTSGITTKALDKKRRLEEEAKNKVGTQQLRAVAERLARSISRLAVLAQEQPEMMQAAPSPPAPREAALLTHKRFHLLLSHLPGRRGDGHLSDLHRRCQHAEAGAGGHQGELPAADPRADQAERPGHQAGEWGRGQPQKAKGRGCRPGTALG